MVTNYSNLPKPFFALAPLDDVTDTVFRQVIAATAAPDIFFTEFVNVDGLQSPGRQKLLPKLLCTASDQPLVVQLWGKHPDNFLKTAQQIADGTFSRELGLAETSTFAGVDLNMGCPDKTVVKNGTCSALINDRELAKAIIAATKEGLAGRLPLSVKTRLGFNTVDMTWPEFLLQQQLAMLTIHGRTRKQMSKVPADWGKIGEIRELRDKLAPQTLVVGNGDVMSRQQGIALAARYKLDGIMIGRGVFHDPFVFSKKSDWTAVTPKARLELYRQHIQLFANTWQQAERPVQTLNKFCKIYVSDFAGAKELRDQLMHAKTTDELLILLDAVNNALPLVPVSS